MCRLKVKTRKNRKRVDRGRVAKENKPKDQIKRKKNKKGRQKNS